MFESNYALYHPVYHNVRVPENEEWRDVVGYEGLYKISSVGRIKSLPRWCGTHIKQESVKELLLENVLWERNVDTSQVGILKTIDWKILVGDLVKKIKRIG